MATDKNRVVAYLSDDEMDEIKALSDAWGLSLSKVIARAVKEARAHSGTVTPPHSGITEKQVKALIDAKVDTLVKEQVTQAIADLTDQLNTMKLEVEELKKLEAAA